MAHPGGNRHDMVLLGRTVVRVRFEGFIQWGFQLGLRSFSTLTLRCLQLIQERLGLFRG